MFFPLCGLGLLSPDDLFLLGSDDFDLVFDGDKLLRLVRAGDGGCAVQLFRRGE